MKTIEQIKDDYAVEQGFESWRDLVNSYSVCGQITTDEFLKHENAVIQLIQYELKKKIAEDRCKGKRLHQEYVKRKQLILNTENIK